MTERRAYSERVWDERETWSRDRLDAYRLERLRRQLAEVRRNSRFYRQRFADVGFEPDDLDSVDDLKRLPITRKGDYAAALAADRPWGTMLAVDPADLCRVHFSSGTTAKPVPDCWTQADLERWTDLYARLAYSQGVRRGDVYQCLFSLAWFVGGLGGMAAFQRIGCSCIPAGSADSERQIETIFDYGTTVISATPSFAAHLAEVAGHMGRDLRQSAVRRILLGGEPGAGIPATRKRLEDQWGAQCFDGYGSLEFQPIAWECEAQAGAHLVEDFAVAEVVDAATGEPVADGTPGVLVLTHLDKQAMPLVRWWTGDIVVRDAAPCACGRTHARLPGGNRGRADDMLVVRGVNVFPTAVEEVVRARSGTTGEYLIVLDDDVRDAEGFLAAIKVRAEASPEAPADLAERLAADIRARLHVRAVVEVVAPGSLPRSTHKAKRIVKNGDPG